MDVTIPANTAKKCGDFQAAEDGLLKLMRIAGWENDGLALEINHFNAETCTFIESKEFSFAQDVNIAGFFIGRHSYVLPGGLLSPHTIIGRYCSIANATGIGVNRHTMEWLSTGLLPANSFAATLPPPPPQPFTVIGSDVWVGFGATVIGGVRVGHGACVGAGAVVTHDVAPYTVVAGVPAKPIRKRFSDDIIAALLAAKWWTLPDDVIRLLPYHDIEACVTFLQNL